jgi:membrane protein
LLALTCFYHVVLPHRLPLRRHLPGAIFAAAFFLVAALVLRAYVADILTTALPYGALAAPIGALLFCFFFGMAVLLGAELNATIQARWPAPLRRHDRAGASAAPPSWSRRPAGSGCRAACSPPS